MDTATQAQVRKRTGGVLLVVVLGVSWSPWVAALDRVGAIDAARKQVKHKCTDATPCKFTATQEGNRWQVRVEFTRRASPEAKPMPYKGGHAIFVFDQGGRVVGRVEGR